MTLKHEGVWESDAVDADYSETDGTDGSKLRSGQISNPVVDAISLIRLFSTHCIMQVTFDEIIFFANLTIKLRWNSVKQGMTLIVVASH